MKYFNTQTEIFCVCIFKTLFYRRRKVDAHYKINFYKPMKEQMGKSFYLQKSCRG